MTAGAGALHRRIDSVSSEAEEALAQRARSGDTQAFARLYERFAPVVHGILIATVAAQEAQDLVQEVFLRALHSIRSLDDPRKVGAWLAAIARNTGRDAHRSARATEPLEGDSLPSPDDEPVVEDDREEAERAMVVLRSLPEAYRETLALRLVEGLTGPEIAARTGMTPGSVRVNLCRGMKLLRERMGVDS